MIKRILCYHRTWFFLRLLTGAVSKGIFTSAVIIAMEITGAKYRATLGVIITVRQRQTCELKSFLFQRETINAVIEMYRKYENSEAINVRRRVRVCPCQSIVKNVHLFVSVLMRIVNRRTIFQSFSTSPQYPLYGGTVCILFPGSVCPRRDVGWPFRLSDPGLA